MQVSYLGPMSLSAQICSSPIEHMTDTTRSFPSAKPSLICIITDFRLAKNLEYRSQVNNEEILMLAYKLDETIGV